MKILYWVIALGIIGIGVLIYFYVKTEGSTLLNPAQGGTKTSQLDVLSPEEKAKQATTGR